MGRMASREALLMMAHYCFGPLSDKQQEAFRAVWRDDCVAPAALESLCAECEDVDSLLAGVAVLVQHSGAGAAGATAQPTYAQQLLSQQQQQQPAHSGPDTPSGQSVVCQRGAEVGGDADGCVSDTSSSSSGSCSSAPYSSAVMLGVGGGAAIVGERRKGEHGQDVVELRWASKSEASRAEKGVCTRLRASRCKAERVDVDVSV